MIFHKNDNIIFFKPQKKPKKRNNENSFYLGPVDIYLNQRYLKFQMIYKHEVMQILEIKKEN